ncbi:MAG: heat-inducible transcriptional repressor HrcA, partial [Pseudomonadota bacterium]
GDPVGSRTISRLDGVGLSPATIRNVMADLEEAGLLYAPHTSAGRLPTDMGMRLFVHGLLEVGRLSEDERANIESQCVASGKTVDHVLEQASESLSGLSRHAGLVVAPKTESPLRHIEFVNLSPGRALAVLVMENGVVENRIIDVPLGIPASALVEAGNFLNARLVGRTIIDARQDILDDLAAHRAELDTISSDLVARGLATYAGDGSNDGGPAGSLIIRGHANLLEDVTAIHDLERVRRLFETLETKETLVRLLDLANVADGVQIFIGSESNLFSHTGCSMIISPYRNTEEKIVGAIGVIGPMRMNYSRIIPMVDYTARVVGRLIG